jgi:hypothetical protein
MLQQILALFYNAEGGALTREVIQAQLGLSPALLDQMLYTLVQRGRLVIVDEICSSCRTCPLEKVCAGVPSLAVQRLEIRD